MQLFKLSITYFKKLIKISHSTPYSIKRPTITNKQAIIETAPRPIGSHTKSRSR